MPNNPTPAEGLLRCPFAFVRNRYPHQYEKGNFSTSQVVDLVKVALSTQPSAAPDVPGDVVERMSLAIYCLPHRCLTKTQQNTVSAAVSLVAPVDAKVREVLELLWFFLPIDEPSPHAKDAKTKERNRRWHKACEMYQSHVTASYPTPGQQDDGAATAPDNGGEL